MTGQHEIENADAPELLQSLSLAAQLVLWKLVDHVDQTNGDFRFTITRGDYQYRAQLVCHDTLRFATLYCFPDVLLEPEDAPVAYELASRLNDFVVVGAFSANPTKGTGLYYRSWRWLDKDESDLRCIRALLNSSDYSLQCFEKAFKYIQEWGLGIEDAVTTAAL